MPNASNTKMGYLMIFARRSIQRFISQLAETLPQDKVEELVRKLNRNGKEALGFEWEVAVLFALDRLGEVGYEADHRGRCFPDVTFRLFGQEKVCFVADVATVSDRGLEDENPIRMLRSFLHEKAMALGMPGGFQYRVEGYQIGKRFGDRKVKLAMPESKELGVYLEKHVTPRLQETKNTGIDEADILINEPYNISITYRKDGTQSVGSYPSYTPAYSLTRNPVLNSLKSKAKQLSRSGFEGCKGIFLCDGYCGIFPTRPNAGTSAYSKHEIIGDFLRQNTSISFAATIWVERPHRGVFDPPQSCRLHFELFPNRASCFLLDDEVAKILQQFPDLLPAPVDTAQIAAYRIDARKYRIGKTHYGESHVNFGNRSISIRISSRALLDLLAGKTNPLQFSEDHWPERTGTSKTTDNPFAAAVTHGMTIKRATVERKEDEDDDWITVELSYPDVAVTPFRPR